MGGFGGYGGYNVQRQDVSLKLQITPHINESDFVRLELEQTIEELGADNPGLGPTTTKRAAKTTIVAKDQQTVVIGGLMRDNTIEGVEKVPFLGDIPLIGYLFRTSKRTIQKQNLLLLLTPYIIRDPSDFRAIFLRKMKEREDFIERYSHVLQKEVDIPVNYDRKHGLLEEVRQTVRRSQVEAEARRRARRALEQEVELFREIGMSDDSEEAPAPTPTPAPAPAPKPKPTPAPEGDSPPAGDGAAGAPTDAGAEGTPGDAAAPPTPAEDVAP